MEENPNYYAIIPARVRYDNNLKPNEKLLYAEITALSSKDGECHAGNSYFARLYNTTKETVSRWIGNLQKQGYIEVNIIYKDNSKEIEKRKITPIDKKINTYCQKNQGGIDKNVKDNNTSNNNNISSSDDELHKHFDKIWGVYPVKKGKQKAETYFLSWIKGRKINGKTLHLTDADMWYAVQTYLTELKETKTDLKYVPHGDTFFNSKIYDYYEIWRDKHE